MAETKIQKITSRRVDEEYYKIDHKSGLAIYVYPKAGYTSSYGIFGTKFGSINNAFSIAKDDNASAVLSEVERVPDGIAHFLEHKLFESEEQDAFERFAKTGANANAYTSFDKTCYLFSTSEKLKENLQILLDFVQAPYFTEKTVQK
ncbi:MAG: insulinase family protein [Oscillospiraceae bacterium]|jgi:hypothetical protein|nr:insulinase family protein [Oscillospiraceae bacterium]